MTFFDEYHLDAAEKLGYTFDLLFAIKLYEILGTNNNFCNRVASDDDVWRFLSIRVIPDIVHSRWGMNETRYITSRRIWLKIYGGTYTYLGMAVRKEHMRY